MLNEQRYMLGKLEDVKGDIEALDEASDGIKVFDLVLSKFQGKTVKVMDLSPFLGNRPSQYAGEYATLSFKVYATGAPTPGAAPGYAKYLRACAMEEKILAAPVTGTAVAGSAGGLTLAVGASAVDDTYNDFLLEIVSGAGAGQARRVKDYVGATKIVTTDGDWDTPPDNTSVYRMRAQAAYAPISGQATTETMTLAYQEEDLRNRLFYSRGSVKISFPREDYAVFEFQFTGISVPADDGDFGLVNFPDRPEPLPVNAANSPYFSVHGYKARAESASFDLGAGVVYRNVVNSESVQITTRTGTCSAVIEKPGFSEKNFDPIFRSGARGIMHFGHGTDAGNIVHVMAPRARLMDGGDGNSDGITTQTLNGECCYSNEGDDDLFIWVM